MFWLKGVTRAPLFTGIDLEIGRGERVGIVGPNGAGKTTLLKVLLGEWEPEAGRIETGETVKVSYIDQTREQLDPNQTVLREVGGGHSSVKIGTRLVRVESFLGRFLFDKKQFQTPVGDLSGGERNRVLLAKLLLQGGNVLVLDEPTNDLDLMTLRVLEEALMAFDGTVLVVTHDRYFLDRVATRILYLDGKGGLRHWPGDMTSLLEQLKTERKTAPKKERPPAPQRKKAASKKRSYKDQRELDGLPDKIAALESEVETLDARFADPAVYAGRDAHVIGARRAELAKELEGLYARWEELESTSS